MYMNLFLEGSFTIQETIIFSFQNSIPTRRCLVLESIRGESEECAGAFQM